MPYINDPWDFLDPSVSGLALSDRRIYYDHWSGRWEIGFTFTPIIWQETVCRWLDERVEL